MNLFELIDDLCRVRGISIARLERETGLGNGSIKKWAHSFPSADRLRKVADYFGVSTDYLLGRTHNPNISPDYELPSDAVRELEAFIEFLKTKYKNS